MIGTRYARVRADVVREEAQNRGTVVARAQPVFVDHRTLFNRHQRRMSQILCDYTSPGVAVFALHWSRGIAGHMWLFATGEVRAGTIGRHSGVDLYLNDDDELSLRHLVVLVKERSIRFIDLATPIGFQVEEGGVLHSLSTSGPAILRAATYSFFAFPTGVPLTWDRDAENPWSTLPKRTQLTEPRDLLQPEDELAGHLTLSVNTQERLAVGAHALDRGIVLGRYSRCAGDTAELSNDTSRVHAMLVRVQGVVHLIDLGSSNGTFKNSEPVKCAPIEVGTCYRLGAMSLVWAPAH